MFKRALPFIATALLGAVFSNAQDASRPVWEQEAMLFYGEGSEEFNRLRTLGAYNPRLSDYVRAVGIMHGNVKTEGDASPHLVAKGIFSFLVEENPEDPVGMASRYYLARIVQSNVEGQDIEGAKAMYLDLFESSKEHFFGQMAFLKYAAIEIYDDPDGTGVGALDRLAALEKQSAEITLPTMSRNLHRLLGEGYVAFGLDPSLAFEHLVQAYELGMPVESIRVDVLMNIARLGEELGELDQSLAAYNELIMVARNHEQRADFIAGAQRVRQKLASGK